MAWVPHGAARSGLLNAKHGQSKSVPAVAAHRGRLWCAWADLGGHTWYAVVEGHEDSFADPVPFPCPGLPVLVNLNGHLHAVVVSNAGDMVHFLYDDDGDTQAWACLGPLDAAAGAVAHSSPSLVSFQNKLFLAFLHDARLHCAVWTNATAHPDSASNPLGEWSAPKPVHGSTGGPRFDGIPALCVLDGVLHLLCGAADSDSGEVIGYRYDCATDTWAQCDDVSEGRSARGVSATSFGDSAYLGFVEADASIFIAPYTGGQWQAHDAVAGQTAADPPQVAILNGRIHCIFNAATPSRDLRWYSRPVLTYSLSSWMAAVPGQTPLSRLTIPGTHDSCARSNIPFVRTQYLDIAQQLALGIRFLDLRLRRREDGQLFCYHGGILIDLPRGLSFAAVMAQVWTFLRGPAGDRPATETVLISINNDDGSPGQLASPGPFYQAVQAAIIDAGPWSDGSPRWFVGAGTPTMSEARGRAVLLRRFHGDPAVATPDRIGLDLSTWKDDCPDFTIVTPTGVRLRLQDKWKFADRVALARLVESKSNYVRALMARAAGVPLVDAGQDDGHPASAAGGDHHHHLHDPGQRAHVWQASGGEAAKGREGNDPHDDDDHWFINFCSAVGDPVEHGEIAEAKWIAVGARSDWIGKWVHGMNQRTRDFLQRNEAPVAGGDGTSRRRKKHLGIVNMDYPELPQENDLVAKLIETNFE